MANPSAKPNMSRHLQADLLLLASTFVASAGWVFSREALAGFSPLTFMALRFSCAGLLLVAIGWPPLARLTRAELLRAMGVGTLFGIAMIFWVLGLSMTSHIGIGAFLTILGLVFVPIISLLFGDRPGIWAFLAIPFAAAGLACLSLDGDFPFGKAEFSFLGAAFFLALMFVGNSHAAARIPALPLTAIQLLVTGVITGSCALVFEDIELLHPPAIWGWFAASVLLATSLRFFLQTRAQGMAPPSHSAIIMILEPVWTTFLTGFWFGERMTFMQASGCTLIFTATLVNRWPALKLWLKSLHQPANIPR